MSQASPVATIDILRSALARGRENAARSVRLLAEGVEIVDGLGVTRDLTVGGGSLSVDVAAVRDLIGGQHYRNWETYGARHEVERVFPGFGTWVVASDEEDGIVLKPKKPYPASLDQVFSADPEAMAAFRNAYAADGVDVFAAVEGETRARDVAVAMAAERNLAGLPTALSLPLADGNAVRYHSRPEDVDAWLSGNDAFDAPGDASRRCWTISVATERGAMETFFSPGGDEGSRVVVMAGNGHLPHRYARAAAQVAGRERPTAVVAVAIEKSAAVARLVLSPKFVAASESAERVERAPWAVLAERKAVRDAARPKKERTWHQTTEAVAQAFAARKAPRGYVSNRSLFFHGPVAFSVWDGNPVAAFVGTADGGTVLMFGRAGNVGGSMAGTVSSAQGDVARAVDPSVPRFHVGDLSQVLTLGGERLKDVAAVMRHRKDEADRPATCSVDGPGMAAWLAERHEAAIRELQESGKTTFPTQRRAHAFAQLQHLAETADTFAGLFGIKVPVMAPAEEMRRECEAARDAANARQEMLAERRRGAVAESREEAPAPRM